MCRSDCTGGAVFMSLPLPGRSLIDCRSAIRLSKLDSSDGFLPPLELSDLAGLDRDDDWLGRL